MTKKFLTSTLTNIISKNINQNKINSSFIKSGDIIQLNYKNYEKNKERICSYEGLIISINNKNNNKTFTLRSKILGIGVEQTFLLNSPKIVSIVKKQSLNIRRSKLYFTRNLSDKILNIRYKM